MTRSNPTKILALFFGNAQERRAKTRVGGYEYRRALETLCNSKNNRVDTIESCFGDKGCVKSFIPRVAHRFVTNNLRVQRLYLTKVLAITSRPELCNDKQRQKFRWRWFAVGIALQLVHSIMKIECYNLMALDRPLRNTDKYSALIILYCKGRDW